MKYLLMVLFTRGDDRAWENKSKSWWTKLAGEGKWGKSNLLAGRTGHKGAWQEKSRSFDF